MAPPLTWRIFVVSATQEVNSVMQAQVPPLTKQPNNNTTTSSNSNIYNQSQSGSAMKSNSAFANNNRAVSSQPSPFVNNTTNNNRNQGNNVPVMLGREFQDILLLLQTNTSHKHMLAALWARM